MTHFPIIAGVIGSSTPQKEAGKPYASLDEETTAFDTALQGGE